MKKIVVSVILVLAFSIPTLPVHAGDEVLTIIDEAIAQYKKGDLAGAASNLDYASQLIRQQKSEAMKKLLPEPLAGWEADPPTTQALGTAVFGGGISASRTYTRKPSLVTIDIVSDSPVLQSLVMMINNPMIVGASGGKLETVNGQNAIVQYNDSTKGGEVSVVVDNRFIVTVKGRQVERKELLAYAEAVDFEALAKK